MDRNNIRDFAGRSVQNYEKTVGLRRYNNHIYYVSNINAVFQSFRCPNCDFFSNRTFNLKRPLTACSERVKNIYPRNVFQIREPLFDKVEFFFKIKYTSKQKFFSNLELFDFESISDQEEKFKDTKTSTWIGKHVLVSIFISRNLVEEQLFLYNYDPPHHVASFIGALEKLE